MSIPQETLQRQERLAASLQKMGRVAIAFSGGVDSTYLLHMAQGILGGDVLALTARSHTFPLRETAEARAFAAKRGIRQLLVSFDEMAVPGFVENSPERCYHCKKALFEGMLTAARQEGFTYLAEGSNMDDLTDYRPGLRAIAELGVLSPLREAGLTKAEIRMLLKEAGIAVHQKPSYACLATRIPYGERITPKKLAQIERAEQCLFDLGFAQARVRHHGDVARIEVLEEELVRLLTPEIRRPVWEALRSLGFAYVAADLRGYVTGSMNDVLPEETKHFMEGRQ